MKIDSSVYLDQQQKTNGSSGSTLGKDDFLKLLMAQLQNQDPLNPMEDKEFISQMTTFSSLEQMMSMRQAIEKMADNQQINPIVQYSSFIGKEVDYQDIDESQEIITSKVTSVYKIGNGVELELENGSRITPEQITRVGKDQINE
ncbi:flagellar hook assembly protein FlgD [Bacillaceae bacterium S4-13-58]